MNLMEGEEEGIVALLGPIHKLSILTRRLPKTTSLLLFLLVVLLPHLRISEPPRKNTAPKPLLQLSRMSLEVEFLVRRCGSIVILYETLGDLYYLEVERFV